MLHPNPSSKKPSSWRRRLGFTLIELLIVVVIIGILAAIAIPKFQNTKGKAYATAMKSDLRNLATAQEAYYYDNSTYAAALGLLNFTPSTGVVVTITQAGAGGWSGTSTHPRAWPLTCAIYFGNAALVAPATTEGVLRCA